jgi:hypothetical protein
MISAQLKKYTYLTYFQEQNFINVCRSIPEWLEYLSKWQQWFPDGCRMTPSEQKVEEILDFVNYTLPKTPKTSTKKVQT